MTTKKELFKKIIELEAHVKDLKNQYLEMPDELKIETVRAYEALDRGKRYNYAPTHGGVSGTIWDGSSSCDKYALASGQVFLTKEAAQREAKRRELWQQCRKAMWDAWEAFGEIPDWANDMQVKRCVYIRGNKVGLLQSTLVYERIHFPTEESLKSWRATVTDDEIKLMLIEEW